MLCLGVRCNSAEEQGIMKNSLLQTMLCLGVRCDRCESVCNMLPCCTVRLTDFRKPPFCSESWGVCEKSICNQSQSSSERRLCYLGHDTRGWSTSLRLCHRQLSKSKLMVALAVLPVQKALVTWARWGRAIARYKA